MKEQWALWVRTIMGRLVEVDLYVIWIDWALSVFVTRDLGLTYFGFQVGPVLLETTVHARQKRMRGGSGESGKSALDMPVRKPGAVYQAQPVSEDPRPHLGSFEGWGRFGGWS